MSSQIIILLSLSGIIFALALINVVLLCFFYKTSKKIDTLLENGKIKSFKEIFLSQNEKNKNLEQKLKETFSRIENLEDVSKKTFQKIGVVRFNPFNEIGGNQSFVIALLDAQNNGFVISSLFAKEGNRVYSKAVRQGKSEHSLSDEEQEAIVRAIGSK